MKLKGLQCQEGHSIGNITYKMEAGENREQRKLVRKVIDDEPRGLEQ